MSYDYDLSIIIEDFELQLKILGYSGSEKLVHTQTHTDT